MAPRGSIHLLFEHAFVDRTDGILRATENGRTNLLGVYERVLGNVAADAPLDRFGALRDLVDPFAAAPFLRTVCVADGHSND